jgi:hypothetical protein
VSNSEIATSNIFERNASVGILESLPNSGIDPKDSHDSVVAGNHHVSKLFVVVLLAQEGVEARIRRQEKNIPIHHIPSLMDKNDVG